MSFRFKAHSGWKGREKGRRNRRRFRRLPLRYGAFLAALPRLWRGTLWRGRVTLPCPAGQGALRDGAPAILVFPCGGIAQKRDVRPWWLGQARLGWRFGLGWAGCFAGAAGLRRALPAPAQGTRLGYHSKCNREKRVGHRKDLC